MWHPLLLWSLKSGLILSFLYAGFYILFRNNSQLALKRVLLITMLCIAAFWPLVKFTQGETIQSPLLNEVTQSLQKEFSNLTIEEPSEITDFTFNEDVKSSKSLSESDIAWRIYLAGIVISFLVFLIEIIRLSLWVRKGQKLLAYGKNVIAHKHIKYPFSFLKWVFVPENPEFESHEWQIILSHENAHLQKRHTLDLLFTSLIQCFLWYQPAIYLIQRSIKHNHETQADQAVLQHTNFSAYSQTLLALSMRTNTFLLSHSFALISSLSKRIKAMKMKPTKKSTTWAAICCFTLLVAIALIQTASYAQTGGNEQSLANDQFLAHDGPNVYISLGLIKYTKESPDVTMINKRLGFVFKLNFPFKYSEVVDKIKDTYYKDYKEDEITFTIELSNDKSSYYKELLNANYLGKGSKTEFITELSDEELEDVYKKCVESVKEMFDKYNFHQKIISFEEFRDQKFLTIKSYIRPKPGENKEETKGLPSFKKIYKAKQVDTQAQPVSGLSTFINTVALSTTKNSNLKTEDIPDKIEFEFVVNHNSMVNQLNLKTKIKGNDEVQNMLYELMGQLNKSILEVSLKYGWQPAEIQGYPVSSFISVEIPKSLL